MSALLKRKAPVPKRVLSEAEMQLFTVTANTGEIVMVGAQGVLLDQGQQAVRVGTSDITLLVAGSQKMAVKNGSIIMNVDSDANPNLLKCLTLSSGENMQCTYFGVKDTGTSSTSYSWISSSRYGSAYNNLCLQSEGGNVGIGTNSPQSTLHVNGTLYTNGNLCVHRSRLSFATLADLNHSIYNNQTNSDGEGPWDGIKMNVYGGLSVRVGNANGATPTTAMYINSSGNVGIGTNEPKALLHVNGATFLGGTSRYLEVNADSSNVAYIDFHSQDSRITDYDTRIQSIGGGVNAALGQLQYTGASHYFLGNVGIGTADPYRPLMVNGAGQIWATPTRYFDIGSGNLTYNADSIGNIAIAALGSIVAGGAIAAYSDERIKANIRPIRYSISDLLALQPVEYTHIDTIKNSGKNQLGFIAQQVKNVCPEVVDDTEISYIPDVYRVEKVIQQSGKSILVSLSKEVSWKAGDKVQIISREKPIEGCSVLEISPSQCLIELPTEESISPEVFLYGKKVEDFHTIDYGKITALLVKCAQDQYHIMSSLSDRLSRLEALLSR
jgi:hypothetical protein